MAEPELTSLCARLECRFGLRLSENERQRLPDYLRLLERWNARLNLTGDAAPRVVLQSHVFEALWAARRFLEHAPRLADIGSGAGFPGLFLALAQPRSRVTLIERQAKRTVFLKQAVHLLGVAVDVFEGTAADYPGWDDVEVASVRAVRLDGAVLAPLERRGIRLLWFCSRRTQAPGPPWRPLSSLPVPASERRLVQLLAPAG